MDTSEMRVPLQGAAKYSKWTEVQNMGHPWDAPFHHHNAL